MSPESESFQIPQAVPSSEDADSFKLKYEERKALIKTSDEELIVLGKKESHSFKNATDNFLTTPMFWSKDILDEHFEGKRLIELGSGMGGLWRGIKFMSPEEDTFAHDFGISEFVAVDLFVDPNEVWKEAQDSLRFYAPDEERRESIRKKLTFEQRDMFGYLLEQPDNSANVMMSSVDYALIPSREYHQRVAQEIFRVVPEDGVFVMNNCPDIEDEMKKLFPFCFSLEEVASTRFYSKREICPQVVADTKTFQFFRFLLEASQNGILEMTPEIARSIQPDGELVIRDMKGYLEQAGFVVDFDQFTKVYSEEEGSVSISKN